MKKTKKTSSETIQRLLEFDLDAHSQPQNLMEYMFKQSVTPLLNKFYSKNGQTLNEIKKKGADILKEWYEISEDNRPVLETVQVPVESGKVLSISGEEPKQEFKEEQLPKMKEGKSREDAKKALEEFHGTIVEVEL